VSRATGLDHVALAVADLGAAAAAWQALGFALTPLARHLDDAGQPTGTANRCAMLRRGYVELLAVVDPARPSRTLADFIARYEGAHIISLAVDDAAAAQARLARAGLTADLAATSRPAESGTARFERLPLPGTTPRLQLIRHLTPELVWRPADVVHPNHAAALDEVVIAADPPAELAALLSRLAGVPVLPDPVGGYALALATGRVRVLPPNALGQVFPGLAIPSLPFVAGVVIRTDDGNATVTALGIGRPTADGIMAQAAGTAVLFRG
jgi:hypothetical protein